jgi:RNA polymerase sigma factor (sigma-70 family)
MDPDDQSLISACRNGDSSAWETLVQRYQRLVYSIPRRAGLDDDQTAEVFQRTWVALVENLERLQQPDRVGAWLATTARRESWRLQRRSRADASPLLVDDDGDIGIPDPTILPDEQLIQIERRHQVRLAVVALDERCRKLLELLFYTAEPPAYSTIAQALGTSEGSIGPTRARCLQKLRRLLESAGEW